MTPIAGGLGRVVRTIRHEAVLATYTATLVAGTVLLLVNAALDMHRGQAPGLPQFVLYAAFLCIYAGRHRIGTEPLAAILLITLYAAGTFGYLLHGFVGYAAPVYMALCFVAASFFGVWGGIAMAIVVFSTMLVVAQLALSGYLVIDATAFLLSPFSWVAALTSFAAMAGLVLVQTGRMSQHLGALFLDQRQRMAELERVNARLESEIVARAQVESELRRQSALLENILTSLPQGISVFDDQLKLVVWNEGLIDVLELPPELVCKQATFEDLIRVPALRGEYGPGDPEDHVRQRRELAMKFQPHRFERVRPGGRTHLVVGSPFHVAGRLAGFITTYTDITEHRRAEEDLRRSNEVLQSILDNIPGGVSVFDGELRLLACNGMFKKLLDLPESMFATPHPHFETFIRHNAARGEYGSENVEATIAAIVERAGHPVAHQFERERPDGRALDIRGAPLPGGGFVTIYSDITARKQSERELLRLHERITLAAATVGMGIWDWDTTRNVVIADKRVFELFGVAPTPDGRFDDWMSHLHPEDRERVADQVRNFLRGSGTTDVLNYRIVLPDGTVRHLEVHTHVERNAAGRVVRSVGVDLDVTEKKLADEHIQHLAHHDRLTGLPNRMSLEVRLDQSIAESRRNGSSAAVMFLDLDRFKAINDTLGHPTGDRLLIEVARRLRQAVRASDTVARMGGDEFVIVLPGLDTPDIATTLAGNILASLSQPYAIDGHELHSTPSVGIALFPQDGDDVGTVMKNADTAMYHAKSKGRNNFQFFSRRMNEAAMERLDIERSLRDALKGDQFLLHYQPRLDMAGRVTGVEALIRWDRPGHGLQAPGVFIPVAEETDLINQIGDWVLDAACRQLCLWREAGLPAFRVAVNLSSRQLRQATMLGRVARVIAENGISPGQLEFEITESVAMENPQKSALLLGEFRIMGVGLAIDDFGTGYSSLSYLKRLPLDYLKIDRSFVADITEDANDLAIAKGTIALAHSLGLKVIAEGVETAAQLELLRQNGCDEVQGFYFARPLPVIEFEDFLRRHPVHSVLP